jgi:hypothetical protein
MMSHDHMNIYSSIRESDYRMKIDKKMYVGSWNSCSVWIENLLIDLLVSFLFFFIVNEIFSLYFSRIPLPRKKNRSTNIYEHFAGAYGITKSHILASN